MYTVLAALGKNPSTKPIMTDINSEKDYAYECAMDQFECEDPRVKGKTDTERAARREHFEKKQLEFKNQDFVGNELHKIAFEEDYETEWTERVESSWPFERKKLHWLNEGPFPKDLALAYLTYGNEALIDWKYSLVAVVADVAPWQDRARATAMVE